MATNLECSTAAWTTPPSKDLSCSTAQQPIEACVNTQYIVGVKLEACVRTLWENIFNIDSCVNTQWNNELPIEACLTTTWDNELPIEACLTTTWNNSLPLDACLTTTWGNKLQDPFETCLSTEWELIIPIEACLNSTYLLSDSKLEACVNTQWKFANPIEACTQVNFLIQNTLRLDLCTRTRTFLGQDLATSKCSHVANVRYVDGSTEVALDPVSVNVSGAQGSFGFRLSLSFADELGWIKLEERCTNVLLEISGVTYKFLIESKSKSISRTACSYGATGISPTVLLTGTYADDICKDYSGYLLSAAMAEIASTEGFTVDYQIEDVTIPTGALVIKRTSPMDALINIAKRMGAIVQSDPGGETILVQYPYKVAITQYDSQTLINSLSAEDNIFSYSSRWQPQPGYDSVIVAGKAEQPTATQYTITYLQDEGKVRVTSVPDVETQPDLKTDTVLGWSLTPVGSGSEFVSECVELKNGTGSITGNPLDGFVTMEYVNGDESIYGTLSREGSTITNSITSIKSVALVQAAYQSKFWEYTLNPTGSQDDGKIVLYIE